MNTNCHSEPVTDVTGVGIRNPSEGDGLPRRYAPRNDISCELAFRELARRNYGYYLKYVNGANWKDTAMSRYLAQRVQDFLDADTGNSYDILVIETPPQHGKSSTITEAVPSWYLGKHPNASVIMASYDSEFAERFCRRNREKLKRFGGNLFGVSVGSVDRSTEFELSSGGRLISRGIMSGITGNPANLILIDDPVKNREEADSKSRREKLWDEWLNSLKTRLSAGGKVIAIMTPWHEDDFAARLLKTEQCITLIRLPVEAEEDDPLGRSPGDSLCPELGKDNSWLAQFKAAYVNDPKGGMRSWNALYQCRPRTEEGGLVKRSWWRYYDNLPKFPTEIISVDASFKGDASSDFVSIQVWGKCGQDYYLIHCLNQRLNFPETIKALELTAECYPEAKTILIEEAANGAAIIDTLSREMFIIPVKAHDSKESRVNAVSAAIESGHVYLPTNGSDEFVEQFTAFPNAVNDDMVDAATMALRHLVYRMGAPLSDECRGQNAEWNNIFNPY